MNREFNIFTINKLLRIIVFIFIDTFFSVYFFNLVNYDLLPIAIYNLFIYVGLFSSFYLPVFILRSRIYYHGFPF